MHFEKYIGVIGGMGSVGRLMLQKLTPLLADNKLLIGGRRSIAGETVKAEFGPNVSYQSMNCERHSDLQAFCNRCSLVINVSGPSLKQGNLIALQALACGCHYIDVGGYDILYQSMQKYEKDIREKNLCFIIGAGWMPGISGIFSKYIMDTYLGASSKGIFRMYFGAVDTWSYSSCYDLAVSSMRKTSSYIYAYGAKKPLSFTRSVHQRKFEFLPGKKRCFPMFDDQLSTMAVKSHQLKEISSFVIMNDYMSMMKFCYLSIFKRKDPDSATQILRNDYERLVKKQKVWGGVFCEWFDSEDSISDPQRFVLYTVDNLMFTALPSAIIFEQMCHDKVAAGLHYACDAIDCCAFMKTLKEYSLTEEHIGDNHIFKWNIAHST
ncbi:saccharopine dehydrogenase NADP-binding domain-containing protein [Porphyromonas pogonae]|uniref:saccharopine dehydrogenase NADP-binding domain-containing protein n=1 Tax=Porphyromonas pogonae TaxID=867595 RepID=UPI002E75E459|nr:saccharopine dehydrogenase NADP-binding domain-containing protein [Porphyromonas pogonae]